MGYYSPRRDIPTPLATVTRENIYARSETWGNACTIFKVFIYLMSTLSERITHNSDSLKGITSHIALHQYKTATA